MVLERQIIGIGQMLLHSGDVEINPSFKVCISPVTEAYLHMSFGCNTSADGLQY